MIYITNLSKSYGKKDLFKKLHLAINRNEKIGLIGANGTGKSTLFFMILNKIEPSSGNIQINKDVRLGYLPQEANFKSESCVLSELVEGDEIIMKLKKEKETLELNDAAGTNRYGEVLHALEFRGYFDLEHRAKRVLMGLGFKENDFKRQVNQMSL